MSDTPLSSFLSKEAKHFMPNMYVVPAFALEQLERENAALRADKERLDSGRILLRCHDSFQGWQSVEFIGQDLRDAIDAARKAQP